MKTTMQHSLLKWGALLCVVLLLPWASLAFAAASQADACCCPCCQNGMSGGAHDCGMQGKSGTVSSCASCSMPLLAAGSGGAANWQAFPYQHARDVALKILFVPNIFHPPKIS